LASGIWPGTLWYLYENTNDLKMKEQADAFSKVSPPFVNYLPWTNDLGFQVSTVFGMGYRLNWKP